MKTYYRNANASNDKIRILHLEDLASDAEQIAWTLKKAKLSCEFRVVDTREQYERALTEFKPEIVISDHSLPSFNSLDALHILQQSGYKIPFILVTGAVSEEFAASAMHEGADDYILKDRMQRLPVAILGALNKYSLEREKVKKDILLRNIDINSLDMICSIDADGRFVHVSAASLKILGYHPLELQGRRHIDLVMEEDIEITLKVVGQVMDGKSVTMFENRYLKKCGSIVPMLWSARWEDSDQTMYCVGKDATEKKDAEETIAAERKRLSDLFLNAPISMCILKGKDHVFELANPVYLQKSAQKDVAGRPMREMFPEGEGREILERLDAVYKTGEFFFTNESVETIGVDDTGMTSKIYFNRVFQPYRGVNGNVEGIFYFGVNVTDQVIMRQKVEESRQEYVHMIQNLPVAIYTCDAEGKILLYNKAALELWGRVPQPETDTWCGSWKIYDNDNVPIPVDTCSMAKAIREGKNVHGDEIIIERPDGTRRNVIPYPSPNFNSKGIVTGAINVLIDITNRKKVEIETLTLVDQLEFKNSELKQFAYMVSHNLRAPIARILGLASIFGKDTTENGFILDKITEAAVDLDSVVRDINMVLSARHSEGMKVEYIDFETELNLIKHVLDNEIRESKATISVDFRAVKGTTTVSSYVYSIIYNLLSNAIKYRLPGVPLKIFFQTTEDEKFVCLSVKDNGMGIDLTKNSGKIFGLYKRFHGSEIPGKGIGLHLVKTHAESLGGRVDVESKINEGIQFRIYLPKHNEHCTA